MLLTKNSKRRFSPFFLWIFVKFGKCTQYLFNPKYEKNASIIALFFFVFNLSAQNTPLPEHPRPDFERTDWQNLNGTWEFEFDSLDTGVKNNWASGNGKFSKKITVPFPWGSKLSGVKNEADIAWYKKTINVPVAWKNKATFFTIGASDWLTTVWIDGQKLGEHEGGYTPFSFDLTPYLKYGTDQKIVVRVDDARRQFTLYGKQGYGDARGMWQTPYLEARGKTYFETIHFLPNIDDNTLTVKGEVGGDIKDKNIITLQIAGRSESIGKVVSGNKFEITFDMPNAKLWSLEDPFLYDVSATVNDDKVKTYFGYRKIGVTNLPGTEIPYVSINNKPVYLQLTLDQSYHPDGFYTFPSDEFMKNEVQLCKDWGINGLRTHIKVDIPRKLYWADKLGVLVMSDLPNSWGEPDAQAQAESEYTLREMIKRDFNHPAIFSWIVFNETWGLFSNVEVAGKEKPERKYLPSTQNWVASMYYLAKSLDGTRIVEDNSVCCGRGHTETDLISWHEYLPGYEWENHMQKIVKNTYEGSTYLMEKGFKQGDQPMINSECGNVWGYNGSTGDVDWTYDYHQMMNVFRKYPQMAGWLYTEHHDVINEWNGYVKFDRTPKITGLEEIVDGMTLRDFHSLIYLSNGNEITKTVKAGESVSIPMFLSSMTDAKIAGDELNIDYQMKGMNDRGEEITQPMKSMKVPYKAWMQKELNPLSITAPNQNGLYTVGFVVKDNAGKVHHRNFVSLEVTGATTDENFVIVSQSPKSFKNAEWSLKNYSAMDGLKVNGAGSGYFEYEFTADKVKAKSGYVLAEIGAKELFAKDRMGLNNTDMDYMLGAIAEPSQSKNSYPMTDMYPFASKLNVSINGKMVKTMTLADDPADHRGILSWHHQTHNRTLDEAGSYGYLVKIPLTKGQISDFQKAGKMTVRFSTDSKGGLAIYGKSFGRYPFDPSVVLKK